MEGGDLKMIRTIKFYYLIVDCTHTSTNSSKYALPYRVSGQHHYHHAKSHEQF